MKERDALYTGRTRFYADETGEIHWLDTLIANKPLFNPLGCEYSNKPYSVPRAEARLFSDENRDTNDFERSEDDVQRAARRARKRLFEISLCTFEFKYFVTLTLSKEEFYNRADYRAVIKAVNTWLDNRVRRKNLTYLLVPEPHKDGAIHFHGFFNSALPLVDSGTVIVPEKNKPVKLATADRLGVAAECRRAVYNIPDWNFGFSTAIELSGSRKAACAYVSKYITKSGKVGGRYYLSGGALRTPKCTYFNAPFPEESELSDSEQFEQMFDIAGTSFYLLRPKYDEKKGKQR